MTSWLFDNFRRPKANKRARRDRVRPRALPLRLESLEDRLVPSLTPQSLGDLNPGLADSNPSQFTAAGSLVFFSASDGAHGNQLWETNGTAAGTQMVKDINPASTGANIQNLTNVNGELFFTANDGVHGQELWKSDGTAAGTQMVADINPGGTGSYPYSLTNVNGTLFFVANDPVHGQELWKSDGTTAGTVLVKDINPGANNSYAYGLTNLNGTLFFSANDGVHGQELWKSDGTAAGTQMVADIRPGLGGSSPAYLTNVNGELFFTASDGVHGNELWKSDGTAAGTQMVADINPGSNGSFPYDLRAVGGELFFAANDGAHGQELWKSDGTAAGTQMVADVNPGSGSSNPGNLTAVGGELFFSASDPVNGTELWKTDGTAAGTQLVKDVFPGPGSSSPAYLTNVNGTLFFSAGDGSHGTELWTSDGTTAGTQMVKDLNPGTAGSYPRHLAAANGMLFFSANDGVHGQEPWVISPNTPPTNIALSNATVAENVPLGSTVGTLSSTDPDGDATFTYSLVSGTGGNDNADFSIVGNSLVTNGTLDADVQPTYSVRVRTTDQAGLTFEKVFTITATDVAPVTQPGSYSVNEEGTLNVPASSGVLATAVDDDPLTAVLVSGPANAQSFSLDPSGAFVYTAQDGFSGTDTFQYQAVHGSLLSPITTVTITVSPDTTPPAVTGVPAVASITEGQTVTFTAQGTDAGHSPGDLTYSLVGAPAGATINASTGVFTWATAEGQDGVYNFTVRVTDGDSPTLFTDQAVAVTVNELVLPPTLAPIGPVSYTSTEITFAGQATNPEPGPLTWSLQGAPAGASIDANGVFHWTPGAGQLGQFTFNVGVNNGLTATVYQPVTVTTLGVVNGNLIVVGTGGDDNIRINAGNRENVRVTFDGQDVGSFAVPGQVFVYAMGGNDTVTVTGHGNATITGTGTITTGPASDPLVVTVDPPGTPTQTLTHHGNSWTFVVSQGSTPPPGGHHHHHQHHHHGLDIAHDLLLAGWSDLVADLHKALGELKAHA